MGFFLLFLGDDLWSMVLLYQSRWWADSTLKTRTSQWKFYFAFCEDYGVEPPLPASRDTILMYIAHMASKLTYVSLVNYLSALWSLHKLCDYPYIDPTSFRVRQTLLGVKRTLGAWSTQARPLEVGELVRMYNSLDHDSTEDQAFWLAILLCFRGLLRKSNVVEQGLAVVYQDVSYHPWGVGFSVRRTKTIRFGERVLFIPFTPVLGSCFCIVTYLQRFLGYMGYLPPSTQLISYYKGGSLLRGTYSWFRRRLSAMCSLLQIEHATSHSLRRGGSVAMYEAGFPLEDIRQMGDWKSMAVLVYLSRSLPSRISLDKEITKRVFLV